MSRTILVCLQEKSSKSKTIGVNTRATLDTGAAGHVMPAEMFPRVKLDRTSLTKKFGAAMEKGPKTWVRRPYHSSLWKECRGAHNSGVRVL